MEGYNPITILITFITLLMCALFGDYMNKTHGWNVLVVFAGTASIIAIGLYLILWYLIKRKR